MFQHRGSPSYSQECRAVQLRVKREDCKSFELDCKSFELDCKSFELECISCFAFVYILLLDVHVFIAGAVQETTACISCVGNRCQGIQFCLQKPSSYRAEAVHRFCRCLTVATVLDFSCLVMSVHVMFISLFWICCQLFSFVTSWMSLAYSWTHLDSLDDVCNSFHSCHGFAVQLVDSFSLLCFWDVLATCCT